MLHVGWEKLWLRFENSIWKIILFFLRVVVHCCHLDSGQVCVFIITRNKKYRMFSTKRERMFWSDRYFVPGKKRSTQNETKIKVDSLERRHIGLIIIPIPSSLETKSLWKDFDKIKFQTFVTSSKLNSETLVKWFVITRKKQENNSHSLNLSQIKAGEKKASRSRLCCAV